MLCVDSSGGVYFGSGHRSHLRLEVSSYVRMQSMQLEMPSCLCVCVCAIARFGELGGEKAIQRQCGQIYVCAI